MMMKFVHFAAVLAFAIIIQVSCNNEGWWESQWHYQPPCKEGTTEPATTENPTTEPTTTTTTKNPTPEPTTTTKKPKQCPCIESHATGIIAAANWCYIGIVTHLNWTPANPFPGYNSIIIQTTRICKGKKPYFNKARLNTKIYDARCPKSHAFSKLTQGHAYLFCGTFSYDSYGRNVFIVDRCAPPCLPPNGVECRCAGYVDSHYY